jgi:hypothetical protein
MKLRNAAGESNVMSDAILYDPIFGFSASAESKMIEKSAPYADNIEQLNTTEAEQIIQIGDYAIYPNPTKDILNIASTGDVKLTYIELINLNGTVVLKFNPQQTGFVNLNMTGLNPGIYILRLVSNQGIISKPIIKQ